MRRGGRTRIALAPPPPDFMTSGQRRAAQRRSGSSALRDVSAVRCSAPAARASSGGHHGGTSWSSATSHGHAASAAENSASRSRPAGGTARPWNRFQVRINIPTSLFSLTRHFLTGEELSEDELAALLARAADLKAAPHSSDALADRVVAL